MYQQLKSLADVLAHLGARRALLLFGALLFNSFLEGLGIATLVPLLVFALGQDGGGMPPFAREVLGFLENAGLPVDAWSLAFLAAGILVVREIIGFGILVYAGFMITDIATKLRRQLLTAVVEARWTWFHDMQLGGMAISLAQFTSFGAQAMEQAVKALTILFRTLVYIALILLVSPALSVVMGVAGLLLMGPLLLLRFMQKFGRKYAGSTQDLSSHFADVFASIKTFKAMGMERGIRPLLDHFIARMRKLRRRILLTEHGMTALQNILAIIMMFATLYVAIYWLNISTVEVGVVAGLMVSVVKNLTRVQKYFQMTVQLAPYLERVDEIIHSAREAREVVHDGKPPSLQRGITFEDVHFSHPGKPVLQGVNFTMPARRITVLTGPSGAGKTTIVDLVIGLQKPQAGCILIDDTPLEDIDLAAWRRMIGYVPQELILLSGNVRDNITLGTHTTDERVWHALELAGAADFVRELPEGLDTDLGERGVKLSGGQRQRLSLARALVREPALLILDEVTSALDPETERKLVRQISQLASDRRITVIAITHTPAWQGVADLLLHLEHGKVRIQDTDAVSRGD